MNTIYSCMRGKNRHKTSEWFRICPVCGNKTYHKNKRIMLYANKNKTKCWECRANNLKEKMSGMGNPMFGKKHTDEAIKIIKAVRAKQIFTPESYEKMRIKVTKIKRKPENRQKMRMYALERINKSGSCVSYNKKACIFFDYLNKKLGWKGMHALCGGEKQLLGYSLDYYEPNLNLVIEWDERQHFSNGELVEEDIERQNNILTTGCLFYRIRQSNKEFTIIKDVNHGNDIKQVLKEYVSKKEK